MTQAADNSRVNIKWIKTGSAVSEVSSPEVVRAVGEIIGGVRAGGFDAVAEYSAKLDKFNGPFAVPFSEAERAARGMSPDLRAAIERAVRNVRRFHSLQRETLTGHEWELEPGVSAGFRYAPVDSAAVYIPGGRYPLASSAIMCVIPAQEAGVRRIAAFSPPGRDGKINGTILGVLGLLGVREIWSIGGAHAIAAAALGAGDIAKVDFIAGPGNAYVAEAKRALFGTVGIDGLAGPSETLIIADGGANPRYCARDLLAQSEHDPMAKATLIATDEPFARAALSELDDILPALSTRETAEKSWTRNGAAGIASSLDDAIEYANLAAPEHLQLAVSDPRAALEKCRAYGAAFLGYSSSEVFGDYIAGTNHTLPTASRAKFSNGLWTGSFLRTLTHLDLSREAAASLAAQGRVMARAEGLDAHERAIAARIYNDDEVL
ncbi:histidinol dehydrogenase [Synergistales bacterium]|nr:histidinol dehydrogenase [Synergistales bacterium]